VRTASKLLEVENLNALNFGEALHNNVKATQLKNDLVRNPENAPLLAALKSEDGEIYAQAVKDLGQLAQEKFGLDLSKVDLYDGEKTTSGSLGDNPLTDVKGGTVVDANNQNAGDIFVDAGNGASKTDMANTLGHEILESQDFQGKDSSLTGGLFGKNTDQQQESLANAFGDQFADRINQAAGGDLDSTGGADFNNNLKNSAAVKAGTQKANTVGNARVEHRQYIGIRGGDVSRATEFNVDKESLQFKGQDLAGVKAIYQNQLDSQAKALNGMAAQDPQKFINIMVDQLGAEKVKGVLENKNLSNDEKLGLLIGGIQNNQIKGINAEEFDSSIITLGVKIKEIDPETKVKIFDSGQKDNVVESILKDYEEGEQIIIQGHSAGGGDAQDIPSILKARGIERNLITVQLDSIEPLGDDASVSNNVNKAINVYQNESQTGQVHIDTLYPNAINGEDEIKRELFNDRTVIVNREFKDIIGPSVGTPSDSHRNIDNDHNVQEFIRMEVLQEIVSED
jgi:hypothetical protein